MNKRMAWAGVCLLTLLITAGCEQSARAKTAKGSAPTAGLPGDAAGNSAGAPTVATAALALPGIENVMTGIYERVSKSVVNIQVRKAAPAEGQGGPGGLRGFGGRGHGFDPFGFPPGDGDDEQGQGPGPGPQQKGRKHYQQGSGSGFVWDTDGHIVSNNHVVGGADKLTVTFSDGTQVPGKRVGMTQPLPGGLVSDQCEKPVLGHPDRLVRVGANRTTGKNDTIGSACSQRNASNHAR